MKTSCYRRECSGYLSYDWVKEDAFFFGDFSCPSESKQRSPIYIFLWCFFIIILALCILASCSLPCFLPCAFGSTAGASIPVAGAHYQQSSSDLGLKQWQQSLPKHGLPLLHLLWVELLPCKDRLCHSPNSHWLSSLSNSLHHWGFFLHDLEGEPQVW